MATSAFRSNTKRTPIPSSSSTANDSVIRRSRSLSRFSRRSTIGNDDAFDEDPPRAPTGRFVNTVRGSCLPEISLDDLAIEFFCSSGDRGSSVSRRDTDVSPRISAGNSQRGRSVSRKSTSGSYKRARTPVTPEWAHGISLSVSGKVRGVLSGGWDGWDLGHPQTQATQQAKEEDGFAVASPSNVSAPQS